MWIDITPSYMYAIIIHLNRGNHQSFTYLGSSVSSTKNDINTQLAKEWTAINRLLVIWKSDLSNKIKCSFFQVEVVSVLLYGCTTWTLTKCMEKKLDGNYTSMY